MCWGMLEHCGSIWRHGNVKNNSKIFKNIQNTCRLFYIEYLGSFFLCYIMLHHAASKFSFCAPSHSGVVCFGDFKVELACLLAGGLSVRSYSSIDLQSDKDCGRKFNPNHLTGQKRNGLRACIILSRHVLPNNH